jgi:hypothetical protein
VRLKIDEAPRPRDRRVVWRYIVQVEAEEVPQRQLIRCPPGDPALRIDAFEVPNQQQPEIGARRQARPAPIVSA